MSVRALLPLLLFLPCCSEDLPPEATTGVEASSRPSDGTAAGSLGHLPIGTIEKSLLNKTAEQIWRRGVNRFGWPDGCPTWVTHGDLVLAFAYCEQAFYVAGTLPNNVGPARESLWKVGVVRFGWPNELPKDASVFDIAMRYATDSKTAGKVLEQPLFVPGINEGEAHK